MADADLWPGTPVVRAPASSPTMEQRGGSVTGPFSQRADAQAGARIAQRQEQSQTSENANANTSLQLLEGLGHARRLIAGGAQTTPTGPAAPALLETARLAQEFTPTLPVSPYSASQIGNLGELNKLSTLAATAISGTTAGGSDAKTRDAVRQALFGIDRDPDTNSRNVNYLMRQYIGEALDTRSRQAWRARWGDENAINPVGQNVNDYIAALRQQIPTNGADFEDRSKYNTAVRTPRGTVDLPEISSFTDSIVNAIRGGGAAASANANPGTAMSPQPQTTPQQRPQFQEGRTYVDANNNRALYRNGQFLPVR